MSNTDQQDAMTKCPRPAARSNWQALPLTSQEGFVLSRVDGATSPALIADMSGLPRTSVVAALRRLEELGLLVWEGGQTASAGAASRVREEALLGHPSLAEPGDLSRDERLEILRKEGELGASTPWQLLGITPGADEKAIKHAYFAASRRFHPDRFFGKNLGSFAGRLARIFVAIKDAYAELADQEARSGLEGAKAHAKKAGGS
jgi:hypothetical protein